MMYRYECEVRARTDQVATVTLETPDPISRRKIEKRARDLASYLYGYTPADWSLTSWRQSL